MGRSLVSRAYVEGLDYQDDVQAFFLFGTPHWGVEDILLEYLANDLTLGWFYKNRAPAVAQFSVSGIIDFNRDYQVRRNGVSYYTIGGDVPDYTRNALGLIDRCAYTISR